MSQPPSTAHRLPSNVKPRRYDISLIPDLPTATFSGTVAIDIEVLESTGTVTLNAADLNITSATIEAAAAEWVLEPTFERLEIAVPASLGGRLQPGVYVLKIEFDGVLNDQLRGWYRSSYSDADGTEHTIATSQMQATDCRRAFPCWDEPAFKAVFGVSLIVDDDMLAISNGAQLERTPAGTGKVHVRFADTIAMSSYLVAVVVGPLEATPWVDVDGVQLRIVHTPGKDHMTSFGLEIASFALRWFQAYYGIAYPGDKVELVALPDFAAGAMENLGCITFRETALLVDPRTSTQQERQTVADVVAHELAHMWFGDLVTMRWWNGIWLNEAFATFMELRACDQFRPEWERWNSFALERTAAFDTDSLNSTRPIEYHVDSPADADGMFDVLTYLKGGALLRMLEQHLGEEAFRIGVSNYLTTHAYGNTDTADLWDAMEHATDQPVRALMDSWIWQPGYPLISAHLDENGHLGLSQERFCFEPVDAPGADDADEQQRWMVPIRVRAGEEQHDVVVSQGFDTVAVSNPNAAVVVNADGHGFFRVAYDDVLLQRFTPDAIASMSVLERYGLVDDTWSAVAAGRSAVHQYLGLIQQFGDERSLDVWQRIGSSLSVFQRWLIDDPEALAAFRSAVVDVVGPRLAALREPGPDDGDLERALRGYLVQTAAVLGHDAATIERARAYYRQWGEDAAAIDAELGAAATEVVAAFGDQTLFDTFVDFAVNASSPQTRLRHLNALAAFDSEALMRRTVELALSDSVRSQDGPFLLRRCIAHPRFGRLAWQFVKDHWDEATQRFPKTSIDRMVSTVATLDTRADVDDAAQFFADHPIPQAALTLEQTLERQRVNAATREREGDAARAWFVAR